MQLPQKVLELLCVFVSVQDFVAGWWVVCEQRVHVITSS